MARACVRAAVYTVVYMSPQRIHKVVLPDCQPPDAERLLQVVTRVFRREKKLF